MPSPARDAFRVDDVRGSAAFERSEPCFGDEDGGFVSMLVADSNDLVVGDYAVEYLRPVPPGFARADGTVHREPAQIVPPIGLAPASFHPAQHETEWASGIDDGPGRVVVPVSLRPFEVLLGLTDAGPAPVDYPCRFFYLYKCATRKAQTREAARFPGPEVVVFHAKQVAVTRQPVINGDSSSSATFLSGQPPSSGRTANSTRCPRTCSNVSSCPRDLRVFVGSSSR